MSIEFPEDLLPLPGAISGAERILANKNTVTLDDVKEFVLGDLFISAEPIELNFQPTENLAYDIQWLSGSITRIGPVVMIQGVLSYKCDDSSSEVETLRVTYSPYGIPDPLQNEGVPGFASRASSAILSPEYTLPMIVKDGAVIDLNIINPGVWPEDRISFFITYLTDE